jgi:hypothetical protein
LNYCHEAIEVHIFNKIRGYSLAEQGARMAQVFEKVMVRRTHSSSISGRAIGGTLPSVQRIIYDCDFTAQERRHYDAAISDTSTTLFRKTKNATAVEWSTTTYRKLCLGTSWIGYVYLLDYKAAKLASNRKTMSTLPILKDLRVSQQRKKIASGNQIPVNKDTDITDVQHILR